MQVSPVELEDILLRHPDVIDAAVVGVKDEDVGDLPRAVVVVRRPHDVITDSIAAFVNGSLRDVINSVSANFRPHSLTLTLKLNYNEV